MTDITKRRDDLAEENANKFYHAQGDITQVMPWSDCKESFIKGFDAGVAEMQAQNEALKAQLKSKDYVIDVAVKALEKIQDDHFVAEYSSELRNLKKISRTTLEQIQKMRGGTLGTIDHEESK